jgi:hypothetical protein
MAAQVVASSFMRSAHFKDQFKEKFRDDFHEDFFDDFRDDGDASLEDVKEEISGALRDHDRESKFQILENLKLKLKQQYSNPLGALPFSLVEGGIPKGALVHLHGLTGSGKTQMVLKFLAENPTAKVAWIEDDFNVYPVSFSQMNAGLDRILFISAHRESSWALSTVLSSQLFGIVILSGQNIRLKDTELRRFQLMAEKVGSTCVLLSENDSISTQGDWSLSLKLQALRQSMEDPPRLKVVRSRRVVNG